MEEGKIHKKLGKHVDVIVHRGAREIGGTIIEVRDRDESIILDMGISYAKRNMYYGFPFRKPEDISELLQLGITPHVKGLYTEWQDGEPIGYPTDIRGVIITHAHTDHIGLVTQVNRDIPVYLGETAKHILDVMMAMRQSKKRDNINGVRFETFRTGREIRFEDIKVIPIHVDHSIPGSYSLIVETSEGVILYTGDYRLHGKASSLTMDMVNIAADMGIDLMFTEGTRVFNVNMIREDDVQTNLKELFSMFNGEVLLEKSYTDFDRLLSILTAAGSTGRKVLMVHRHAIYLMFYIMEDKILSKKIRDVIDEYSLEIGVYIPGERVRLEFMDKGTTINKEGVVEKAEKLGFNPYHEYRYDSKTVVIGIEKILKEATIKQKGNKLMIFSTSEPVDEESEIEHERILNWMGHAGIPTYRLHCSGHITPMDNKKVVREIKPRQLEVVHSKNPDVLKKFILGG